MRVYLGKASRPSLRKARTRAPSHVFGVCWTPQHVGLEDAPFFVDNGEYIAAKNGEEWDASEWLGLLDDLSERSYQPDFVVLPDGYNDAEKTVRRHRGWVDEVLDRGLPPAWVIQPGLDVDIQIRLADRLGAQFVFVGGANRWKRAHGVEIVEEAHDRGIKVHIGNPGGEDGLVWCEKIGADSADTSTVTQNEYWHYLDKLEEESLKEDPYKKGSRQSSLGSVATDGGGSE